VNRTTGYPPAPAEPTPERASDIEKFHTTLKLIQNAFGLRIVGDGLEIHDDTMPGKYPAIITEDGELELITTGALIEGTR
jgi:hypothetical protein